MTRKQLTNGLRSLPENVELLDIRSHKRSGAVYIQFKPKTTGIQTGLLVISDPQYGTTNPTKPAHN